MTDQLLAVQENLSKCEISYQQQQSNSDLNKVQVVADIEKEL